jgi:hypothetical protein
MERSENEYREKVASSSRWREAAAARSAATHGECCYTYSSSPH